MTNYARMYRFGITPWEQYGTAAAASISAMLDREQTGRSRPFGRALDLGCGTATTESVYRHEIRPAFT
jgi:predicted TPR repeat methyltransferase